MPKDSASEFTPEEIDAILERARLRREKKQRLPATAASTALVLVAPPADAAPSVPAVIAIKLHLACGNEKLDGFTNVDLPGAKAADSFVDLTAYPWPWADASVDEIRCKDYLQTLHGDERLRFLDECWRVLALGKQLTLWVPGEGAGRAFGDPLWPWPPVGEHFFYFADRPWREANGHADRAKCHFHWAPSFMPDEEIVVRNEEFVREAIKFKRNSFHTLMVVLTKLD